MSLPVRRMKGGIFLLSPARLGGKRAQLLFAPRTSFPLAAGLRTREGVPLGEVFRFLSGLYFRGKLAYAQRFGATSGVSGFGSGVLVITPNRGLIPAETRVCLEHLEAFAQTDIGPGEASFLGPLKRDAASLAGGLATDPEQGVVLLGSIATAKYVEPLLEVLGPRLLFPNDFVGRGDMSRGGLLLRQAAAGAELSYRPVLGATRRGARPVKLPRLPRG